MSLIIGVLQLSPFPWERGSVTLLSLSAPSDIRRTTEILAAAGLCDFSDRYFHEPLQVATPVYAGSVIAFGGLADSSVNAATTAATFSPRRGSLELGNARPEAHVNRIRNRRHRRGGIDPARDPGVLSAVKIISADGAAEFGPTARTPVIVEARAANEILEPFRLAQRRGRWLPQGIEKFLNWSRDFNACSGHQTVRPLPRQRSARPS